MRSFLMLICLFSFLWAMTYFYQKVSAVKMDVQSIDILRFSIFGFGTAFTKMFRWGGISSFFQKWMIILCEVVLILTYVIIILVYCLVITKPYEYLLAMDYGSLMTVSVITFFAVKERVSRIIKFYYEYFNSHA